MRSNGVAILRVPEPPSLLQPLERSIQCPWAHSNPIPGHFGDHLGDGVAMGRAIRERTYARRRATLTVAFRQVLAARTVAS
jgi:hypothetical protein